MTKTRNMANITDGTSSTIIVAERNAAGYTGGTKWTCGTGVPRNASNGYFCSAFVGTSYAGWGANEDGAQHVKNPDGSAKTKYVWFDPPGGQTVRPFTPTFIAYVGPNTDFHSASSLHPGGVNVGLVDGSVRFLSQTMEWGTWMKLNAIADGTTITKQF